MTSSGSVEMFSPFEIDPRTYLTFATEDLEIKSPKALVSAMGNINRSLHCRADSLRDYWGIYQFNTYAKTHKTYSFPKKLEDLAAAGILTPRLLNKLNAARNRVEHDYAIPSEDELADYFDIASMFIEMTDRYLKVDLDGELGLEERIPAPPDFDWKDINGEMDRMVSNFKVDRENAIVTIDGGDNLTDTNFRIVIHGETEKTEYLHAIGMWYHLLA